MRRQETRSILERKAERIRSFHVRSVYLFVSVARAEATETSDVDLLVEFDPLHV